MTLARRICPIVDCDGAGRVMGRYVRGGLEVEHAEAVAAFHAQDGADEVWVRLADAGARGVAGLFDRLKTLCDRVFVPVVAWGPIDSAADARLLLGFGADRVVVELGHRDHGDPLEHVARIAGTVGPDRVTAALLVRRVASDKGVAWELCDETGQGTGVNAVSLARELPSRGAGELVLRTLFPGLSPDEGVVHDGDLLEEVSSWLAVPVLSVGEDREPADMASALLMGSDGVASARLFADGKVTVAQTKRALGDYGIPLRPAIAPYLLE